MDNVQKPKIPSIPACMKYYVRFEAFTMVVMKSIIIWDMTPCSPLKVLLCLFFDPEE
jgi:hypothetical protein